MPPPEYAQSPQIDHRYGGYYDRPHDQYPSGPHFYPPPPGMGGLAERSRLDSSPNVMLQKQAHNMQEPLYEGGALSHIETPIGLKDSNQPHDRHFHGD